MKIKRAKSIVVKVLGTTLIQAKHLVIIYVGNKKEMVDWLIGYCLLIFVQFKIFLAYSN